VLREELRARFYELMRDRVSRMEEDFRIFVEELCRGGLAKEVYLVGSRARGDSMPYSDYDIVLVVGDGIDP
jgi:predicted nucleotidyltransferase